MKRVPDTAARIRIGSDGTSIETAGIKYVISPYDEFAIEAALRLKEKQGEGEVVVVTVGAAAAAEQLRAALAMGADRAILLKGDAGWDGLETARALAAELREAGADLILFGMKAVDSDQQQVGPMVGEMLDLPCITVAADIEIEGAIALCHREVEGGVEVIEAPLPAAVTMTKGAIEPRYASLKGIMAAKKKPLEEKDAQLGAGRIRLEKLSLPADRQEGRIVGEGPDAVAELVRVLREEAKVI